MTKEEILEVAAQIFSKKGFHAASMQDIAEAVHLQKASLYHHVNSKQEILLELLNRALDLIIERVSVVCESSVPPEDKLRHAIRPYLQTLSEYDYLAAVLLLEYRSLKPELRNRHIPRRDRFESLWRGLIQEGVQAGSFRCHSPSLATRALLGTMNWTITWFRRDGPLTIEEIADQFADLFLEGLLIRKTSNDG